MKSERKPKENSQNKDKLLKKVKQSKANRLDLGTTPPQPPLKKAIGSHSFFRDAPKKFSLLTSNEEEGQALAQSLQQRTGHDINLIKKSDLRTPDKYNRKRCQDAQGRTYVQLLYSQNSCLFVEETPKKNKGYRSSTGEVHFKNYPTISQLKEKNAEYLASLEIKTFEFTLTKTIIQKRQGAKRGCTQNQVMRQSAQQGLAAAGAELPETGTKERMHWTHLQGWSLGGAQSEDNLELGTAGSNYSTLAWIEDPIKQLIKTTAEVEVHVQGQAYMHESGKMPVRTDYTLTWNQGRRQVTGSTYPLSTRHPTRAEHQEAVAYMQAVRTPQQQKNENKPSFIDQEPLPSLSFN